MDTLVLNLLLIAPHSDGSGIQILDHAISRESRVTERSPREWAAEVLDSLDEFFVGESDLAVPGVYAVQLDVTPVSADSRKWWGQVKQALRYDTSDWLKRLTCI